MSNLRSPQFGAVLFRASEIIKKQGMDAFDKLGVGVDARKISIVLALHEHGPLTSSELSTRIGFSRQLIEQRLKSSVDDGFLKSKPNPDDTRQRIYDFSKKGRPIADRVVAIMVDFERVYDALWAELGVEMEVGLLAMERALDAQSLTARLCNEFPKYISEIVESE